MNSPINIYFDLITMIILTHSFMATNELNFEHDPTRSELSGV